MLREASCAHGPHNMHPSTPEGLKLLRLYSTISREKGWPMTTRHCKDRARWFGILERMMSSIADLKAATMRSKSASRRSMMSMWPGTSRCAMRGVPVPRCSRRRSGSGSYALSRARAVAAGAFLSASASGCVRSCNNQSP